MRLDLENLPWDTALLHQLVRDMAVIVEHRDGEIARLQQIINQLQRAQYGRRSEWLDPGQLVLALEDLDSDIAEIVESRSAVVKGKSGPTRRKPLPEHLEREEQLLDLETRGCPGCRGTLHAVGESVSEMLDWVPAQLRVLRIAGQICHTEQKLGGGTATVAQVWCAEKGDALAHRHSTPLGARSSRRRPRLPPVAIEEGTPRCGGWEVATTVRDQAMAIEM